MSINNSFNCVPFSLTIYTSTRKVKNTPIVTKANTNPSEIEVFRMLSIMADNISLYQK